MGPKLFGLKHRGISSFSNSVISWRHFSHCGRMYSGMGLSQSNLSLHICWSICFPLSVTGAMYPLGSYMEPTVDKMPFQVKSKTSRPEIFLVWISAFCSYIVSIGAELMALVDLTICKEFQTWNWHLNGRLGLHTAIFPCLALPLAWPTLTIIVWSNPLFWYGIWHTLIQFEKTALFCVRSLWRQVGCICEQVLHLDLALQFAIWWLLLAAHPMHKHSWKKKSFLSLKGFLQKSLKSSNLCTAPQNRQMFTLAGPEWLGLLALLESASRLPRPTTDVARDLPLFLSGLCLTVKIWTAWIGQAF